MAKFELRLAARELRKQGMEINAIAEKLGVSKSSVSGWCSDIILTFEQIKFLQKIHIAARHKGRMKGALANKNKKIASVEENRVWAERALGTVSDRDLFMVGIALYWAEGSKKGGSGFVFVNSDPLMVKLVSEWLEQTMCIRKDDMVATISINISHKSRMPTILKFWSNLLELPISNFRNPTFIRSVSKKVYDNHENYFGVLRLSVKKSTYIRYRMLSLIEILRKPA